MHDSNCVEKACVPVEFRRNPNYLSSKKHSTKVKRNTAFSFIITCFILILNGIIIYVVESISPGYMGSVSEKLTPWSTISFKIEKASQNFLRGRKFFSRRTRRLKPLLSSSWDSSHIYPTISFPETLFTKVTRRKSHQIPPECLEAACPENWIGFQRKCFYFSDDIKNWTFSQRFCVSQGADLVQIETLQELGFLLRYKGASDHWIGLSREEGQPWKWINGTEWTSCFPIRGGGECAYLNDNGASSARHYTERKWICAKEDTYTKIRRQNAT